MTKRGDRDRFGRAVPFQERRPEDLRPPKEKRGVVQIADDPPPSRVWRTLGRGRRADERDPEYVVTTAGLQTMERLKMSRDDRDREIADAMFQRTRDVVEAFVREDGGNIRVWFEESELRVEGQARRYPPEVFLRELQRRVSEGLADLEQRYGGQMSVNVKDQRPPNAREREFLDMMTGLGNDDRRYFRNEVVGYPNREKESTKMGMYEYEYRDQVRTLERQLEDEGRERRVAQDRLERLNGILERVQEQSNPIGSVLSTYEDRMVITNGAQTVDVKRHPDVVTGDRVVLVAQTMQVLKVLPKDALSHTGPILTSAGVAEAGGTVEVGGALSGMLRTLVAVEEGDRLLVDETTKMVVQNLGKPKQVTSLESVVDVRWDDVGGCDEAKAVLREAIELPYEHPEMFARYGKKPVNGILLHGAPGNGKTLLGRAAASAIARAHGHEQARGFQYVKGPELLSKFVGESEYNVRELFAAARRHKAEYGYPGTIFIDEADALLGRRGSRPNMGMEATIVPMFLAEMDGMESSSALIIVATNRPEMIDPAVVRPGRVDRKARVSRPNREQTRQILDVHLRRVPTYEDVADYAVSRLCDEERMVGPVPLAFHVSGATVAGLVDYATTAAIRRETGGCKRDGLTRDDVTWAADQIVRDLQGVDHSYANAEARAAIERGEVKQQVLTVVLDANAQGGN